MKPMLPLAAFGLAFLTLPATAHAAPDDWQVSVDCSSGSAVVVITNVSATDGSARVEGDGSILDVDAGQTVQSPAADVGILLPGNVEYGNGDGMLTVVGGFPGEEQLDFFHLADCPVVAPTDPPSSSSTSVAAGQLPTTGITGDMLAFAVVALLGGLGIVLAARRT